MKKQTNFQAVQSDLQTFVNPEKAAFFPRFFKTAKGQYGEGDVFIGITVPNQRIVAKKYVDLLTLEDLEQLLHSKIHEYRLTALLILVMKFGGISKKAALQKNLSAHATQKQIVDFYIANLDWVNNWDLVDSSAGQILGKYLLDKDRSLLYELAHSKHLWRERVAIIATQAFIREKQFEDTFKIAEILIQHKHDLIHKAVGWMLREIGKLDQIAEEKFLKIHYKTMPRTMLRYAIEKFDKTHREAYLKGSI